MSKISKAYEDKIYFSMKVIGSEMKVTEFIFKFNLIIMAAIFGLLTFNSKNDEFITGVYPILVALLKWSFSVFGVSLLTSGIGFYILNKILQNAFVILAGTADLSHEVREHAVDGKIKQISRSQQLLDKSVEAAQLTSNVTLILFCAALFLFVISIFVILVKI